MGPGGGGGSNRLPQAGIGTATPQLLRAFLDGESVTLIATSTDLDGDPLTHRWSVSGTSPGSLSSNTGDSVVWTAGADAGSAMITLIANDGTADSPAAANLSLSTGTRVSGGDLPPGTSWLSSQSPIVVTDHLRVPAGTTLDIEAGVVVYLRGPAVTGGYKKLDFTVDGRLEAAGSGSSSSNAVAFLGGRNIESRQWNGLAINGNGAEESHLRYCRIEDAEVGITVGGTAELFVFGGRIENNATGVSLIDPDGTGPGEGITSKATLRLLVVKGNLGSGIRVNSSALTLRQCGIRDNGNSGLDVKASSDPAIADVDSCRFESNGGGAGANVNFDNNSGAGFHLLSIRVDHSNFGIDVVDHPNNVVWGDCTAYPGFLQDFSLTGNYWGVVQNDQSALGQILDTMIGYSSCDGEPSSWVLLNGDWVISPHFTGAP